MLMHGRFETTHTWLFPELPSQWTQWKHHLIQEFGCVVIEDQVLFWILGTLKNVAFWVSWKTDIYWHIATIPYSEQSLLTCEFCAPFKLANRLTICSFSANCSFSVANQEWLTTYKRVSVLSNNFCDSTLKGILYGAFFDLLCLFKQNSIRFGD